jgi:hypothetical protein
MAAFMSTTSKVYVWTGDATRLVYTPPQGWGIVNMHLSPDASRPFLAISEGPAGKDSTGFSAQRVTVVNVNTAAAYHAFPVPASPGTPTRYSTAESAYAVQWSADGTELFIRGTVPAVLAIGDSSSTVAWDLGSIYAPGHEPRSVLLAPDFARVAYSLFELSGDGGEDLWVLERRHTSPELSSAPQPRRLTDNDLGAYPVRWIGSEPDGSDPDGQPTCLLVMLGAISTGGGTPTGIAVVDTKTGAIDTWYPTGNLVHRPVLADPGTGRALVSLFNSITGGDGRLFWRPLDGRSPEVLVPALDDRLIGANAVNLAGGSALVLVKPRDDGKGEAVWEYWLVETGGSARRLASAAKGVHSILLGGTVGGNGLILEVSTASSGESRCRLWRVNGRAGKVEQIELKVQVAR